MARGISSNLLTALTQREISPYYAIKMDFDGGTLAIWTGFGEKTLSIGGSDVVFTGAQSLLSIGGVEEVADLSAKKVSLSLDGLDSNVISIALGEKYQRRPITILFGEESVSDYVTTFRGKVDTLKIQDDGQLSSIELTAENDLIEVEKASRWRYTQESHKSRYPNDAFFQYVQAIQDVSLPWGRKAD